MAFRSKIYTRVPTEDEEKFERLPPRRSLTFTIYIIAIHLVLIVVSSLYVFRQPTCDSAAGLWPLELPSAESAISYETVTFANSGFSAQPASPYEGPPSTNTNQLWQNLTSVGMYALSADEYTRLHSDFDLTTAAVVDVYTQEPTGDYIVTIEVFHQLHCLNYLRKRLYETPGEKFQPEPDVWRGKHLIHCVDYLRQVLMCHADMTLITLTSDPANMPPYQPNFEIKHTCRNWDAVWEFARQGNHTGVRVE